MILTHPSESNWEVLCSRVQSSAQQVVDSSCVDSVSKLRYIDVTHRYELSAHHTGVALLGRLESKIRAGRVTGAARNLCWALVFLPV